MDYEDSIREKIEDLNAFIWCFKYISDQSEKYEYEDLSNVLRLASEVVGEAIEKEGTVLRELGADLDKKSTRSSLNCKILKFPELKSLTELTEKIL